MHSIEIGGFSISVALIVLAVTLLIGLVIGKQIAGNLSATAEKIIWQIFWVGLVAARIGFVLKYNEIYFASPWDIIDIRDGGWHTFFGIVAAYLFGFIQIVTTPALRKALSAALLTSLCVWLLGSFLISIPASKDVQLTATPVFTEKGEATSLRNFAGKPTVINLWASWCPPCVREMPVFSSAQKQYPDINFVFLNQGESTDTVKQFLTDRKLILENVLLDPKVAIAKHYQAKGLPTTLFFDADGRLIDKRMGELSHATLIDRLAKIQATSRDRIQR